MINLPAPPPPPACVYLCVQVESAGYSDSGVVPHGHHPGGAEDERSPAHKPHHHQDHESTPDSTR